MLKKVILVIVLAILALIFEGCRALYGKDFHFLSCLGLGVFIGLIGGSCLCIRLSCLPIKQGDLSKLKWTVFVLSLFSLVVILACDLLEIDYWLVRLVFGLTTGMLIAIEIIYRPPKRRRRSRRSHSVWVVRGRVAC